MNTERVIHDGPWAELPLSALEHHVYCPRQAALIHVDGIFVDNVYTVHGHATHEAVRPGTLKSQDRHRVARAVTGLPVKSDRLGLFGYCDVVEFSGKEAVPVEHKSGRYAPDGPADVQVAAQALCLREGGYTVPHGVVFSYQTRSRHVVELSAELLARVDQVVAQLRQNCAKPLLPKPISNKRCHHCSLIDVCLPWAADAIPRAHQRLFTPGRMGDFDA